MRQQGRLQVTRKGQQAVLEQRNRLQEEVRDLQQLLQTRAGGQPSANQRSVGTQTIPADQEAVEYMQWLSTAVNLDVIEEVDTIVPVLHTAQQQVVEAQLELARNAHRTALLTAQALAAAAATQPAQADTGPPPPPTRGVRRFWRRLFGRRSPEDDGQAERPGTGMTGRSRSSSGLLGAFRGRSGRQSADPGAALGGEDARKASKPTEWSTAPEESRRRQEEIFRSPNKRKNTRQRIMDQLAGRRSTSPTPPPQLPPLGRPEALPVNLPSIKPPPPPLGRPETGPVNLPSIKPPQSMLPPPQHSNAPDPSKTEQIQTPSGGQPGSGVSGDRPATSEQLATPSTVRNSLSPFRYLGRYISGGNSPQSTNFTQWQPGSTNLGQFPYFTGTSPYTSMSPYGGSYTPVNMEVYVPPTATPTPAPPNASNAQAAAPGSTAKWSITDPGDDPFTEGKQK